MRIPQTGYRVKQVNTSSSEISRGCQRAGMAKSGAVNEKRLLQLVGRIYEAATDHVAMQRLPLVVAEHFASESCLFHFCYRPTQITAAIPENTRLPVGTANFDLKACTAYAEYYHERNEWYARGWKKGFPVVVLGEELMSTQAMRRRQSLRKHRARQRFQPKTTQVFLARLARLNGLARPLLLRGEKSGLDCQEKHVCFPGTFGHRDGVLIADSTCSQPSDFCGTQPGATASRPGAANI